MNKENVPLQRELKDNLSNTTWMDNERYFSADCVFQDHEKPALLVYNDGAFCMSCNQSFSLEYIEKHTSSIPKSYRPTIKTYKILPRWRKWEKMYGNLTGITDAAHKNLLRTKATYFRNRGLDDYIIKAKYGVLDGWGIIPVFDKNGRVIDAVARSIRQKGVKYVVMPHDKKNPRPLYTPNWIRLMNSPFLIIVYGIFTVWSLEALEIGGATGMTGKSMSADLLQDFQKPIFIIPDVGEEDAAYGLAGKLGWRGNVLRVDYPYSCTDLDDIRRQFGVDELRAIVQKSLTKSYIDITI